MHFRHFLPALLAAISHGAFAAPESSPSPAAAEAALLGLVKHAEYRFTPEVKTAYLTYAKTTAFTSLKTAGRDLPADFLAWIDTDPVVAATVYGARRHAADVLVMLRSLELDLGVQAVRKDFTQLALAMAVVHAAEAKDADLTPREPLKVVIPGDPRQPVNTKDPSRQLDLNDHIINFLNDNTLEEDVVIGHKEEPPPLIRNNSYVFPADVRAQRNWPRYPLTAPWPTLTLLAADSQPLREREERWLVFRDKGETRTYGEYIGPIAQQFDMQSARRITPHPFTYGTYQMMAKDGGVCGTMANMGVRTYNTLGIPSCTAGQPGHCALILFACDPKTQLYDCKGGQFATGGPDKTRPHTPWVFGDTDARKGILYYQTIAWAVNFGLQSYLGAKDKLLVDPAIAALAKLCAQKLRPETELHQPVLDQLTVALKTRVTGSRDPKEAKRFAATLTAVASQLKDPAQTRAWLGKLAATIKGHEEFSAGRGKSQRDPTADAIANLLATPVPTKP